MKVDVLWRSDPDRPLDDPVLDAPGDPRLVLRLLRGDVCDPLFDPDGWFGIRPPVVLLRYRLERLALPFIAFRWPRWLLENRACYLGAKVYGVDAPEYAAQFSPVDVYHGSQALCISFRPFASTKKKGGR